MATNSHAQQTIKNALATEVTVTHRTQLLPMENITLDNGVKVSDHLGTFHTNISVFLGYYESLIALENWPKYAQQSTNVLNNLEEIVSSYAKTMDDLQRNARKEVQ